LSRTRKDRPNWVRANDPKERKSIHHKHITVHREKVGERKYIHTPESVERNELGQVVWRTKEYSWMVPVYSRWVEHTGCNIEEPMTWSENWARDGCYSFALDLGYGWPRHSAKKAVSQARRHNVKQQLHVAVNRADWDVDILENPLYAKNCWWD
jgi:hypothetical protein